MRWELPAPEWMSPELRSAWHAAEAQSTRDVDTYLRGLIDVADDEPDPDQNAIDHLRSLRDELWEHEFHRPSPTAQRPAFGP